MKKYILFATATLIAAACSNGTTVKGSVPEGTDQVVVSVAGQDYTLAVTDGQFKGSVPVNVTSFSYLAADEFKESFVSDGSTITFDFREDEDANIVTSSKEGSIQSRVTAMEKWYDGFMKDYSEKVRAGEMSAELDAELTDAFVAKLKETVAANTDNVLGASAITLLTGQVEDAELDELIGTLSPKLIEANDDLQRLQAGIEKRKGTQPGAMFTDFEITQPDGSVAKLSDYVGKGKYILVDFWASWCGPCKREIPNIKAAYEKYKGDKFDILSVAVWNKPAETVKAAEELGVVWNQIINAQRIPTDIYGIEGIPHLILFGPDGTIVKRGEGLRGEGLQKTLGELL